jgi:hypothetical protein
MLLSLFQFQAGDFKGVRKVAGSLEWNCRLVILLMICARLILVADVKSHPRQRHGTDSNPKCRRRYVSCTFVMSRRTRRSPPRNLSIGNSRPALRRIARISCLGAAGREGSDCSSRHGARRDAQRDPGQIFRYREFTGIRVQQSMSHCPRAHPAAPFALQDKERDGRSKSCIMAF